MLKAELASGRQVVGVLIGTPTWAGEGSPQSVPRGLDLPPNEVRKRLGGLRPTDRRALSRPNRPLGDLERARRLGGKLARAHLERIGGGVRPAAQGRLPGDQARESGRAGGAAGPDLLVGPGPPPAAVPRASARGDRSRSRGAGERLVLRRGGAPPVQRAEGLLRAPALFRDLLAERGLARQIWVNETNVTPWDDPVRPLPRGDFRVTLDDQASYVIQAFALGLAAGVERISIYPFVDAAQPVEHDPLGLVRADGSTRPAFDAYRAASRHFRGAGGRVTEAPDLTVVTLDRDDGRVTVAWANGPRAATIKIGARRGEALLVDRLARETIVSPIDGAYDLRLDPATTSVGPSRPERYVVGGPPLILVERG